VAPLPAPEGGCALPLALEAQGYGAVLALGAADASPLPPALGAFLARMADMTARPLSSYSAAPTLLQQVMTDIAPAPLPALPAGMVLVPGQASFRFAVTGTEIEGRTVAGNDVQFPWETLAATAHAPHRLAVPNLFVDATPVTNAQYAGFLNSSGYAPLDTHNFLRDWVSPAAGPPSGWGAKPVTWVDLIDASTYCTHYGKRLPNDWEWQRGAQGDDGRQYPWGGAFEAGRVPQAQSDRARAAPPPDVGQHPAGASPFGLLDMVGLVWQWTNEFVDAHTRAATVRARGMPDVRVGCTT
jgi:formylglycine-generating enzyme required for sulfatase activity